MVSNFEQSVNVSLYLGGVVGRKVTSFRLVQPLKVEDIFVTLLGISGTLTRLVNPPNASCKLVIPFGM